MGWQKQQPPLPGESSSRVQASWANAGRPARCQSWLACLWSSSATGRRATNRHNGSCVYSLACLEDGDGSHADPASRGSVDMNVPAQGLALLVAVLLFALYLVWLIPRFWRGSFTTRIERVIWTRTPQGARTRASVRAMPSSGVFLLVFCSAFLVLTFVDLNSTGAEVAIVLVCLACLAYLTLAATIMLLNRPKCLVPPPLRPGSGLLGDRRGRKD